MPVACSSIPPTKLRPLALSILLACGPSMALDTGSITSSVLSPNCLAYRVVGICFWLLCTPFGCTVKTSTKVRHFIPELVVSSYATTGNNPWTEMATLSSPISGAEGGGNLITPNTQRDNLPRFKNVDGIGHPGGWAATQLASQAGYACARGATAFMPYYLSTLDSLAWRQGIPESFYPESLMPGIREIGRQASGNMWGNVYPRQGFLVQPDDFKAAAVMAQRGGDVMTRNLITVGPLDRSRFCMQLMIEKNLRHLPVLEDGKLVGLLSIRDLVKDVIAEQDGLINHLEQYIRGE